MERALTLTHRIAKRDDCKGNLTIQGVQTDGLTEPQATAEEDHMARRRKTGSGGAIGAAVIGLLVLLATIPREVWIGVGVLVVFVVAIYLYGKSRNSAVEAPQENEHVRPPSRPEGRPPVFANRVTTGSATRRFVEDDEPVPVVSSLPRAPTSFRVPAAPSGFGQARWVPAGEAVRVAGITLPGGLIYVGTSLKTPWGANDPCLIDPSKSIASHGDYTERQMGYDRGFDFVTPLAGGDRVFVHSREGG